MSHLAEAIISLRNKERDNQANFRSLWQETADLAFPRENQINVTNFPGEDKSRNIFDGTAIRDSQDMASGLSSTFIPNGQKFFGFGTDDREVSELETVKRYLARATQVTHRDMFGSNFMLQLNETMRSLVVFGTGNIFSEWNNEIGGLNYKDYDISLYQLQENNGGSVDTMILSFGLTARQAEQEFGIDNLGEKIRDALKSLDTESKVFDFIHLVRKRGTRNPLLKDNLNMPYESIIVDEAGKEIVEEGGFEEFPFAVPRWMKSSFEKYGRGQGTESLADIKILQQMKSDFIECANKWNNPPLEVTSDFEGIVNVTPGAINNVGETGSIQGIRGSAMGSFPITKDALEFQQEIIHKAFFRDIFVQLSDLTGDRRTTVEIRERIREGLRRLALPVARLQSELFDPLITRTFMLLIRNGRIPDPPPELAGKPLKIEYQGELALALRDQEAKGFLQLTELVAAIDPIFPGAKDNIEFDTGIRNMGRSFGVNEEVLASEESLAAKRQAAAEQLQQQQALQAAQVAAEGYGKTTDTPQPGSPAEALMNAG